MNRILKILPFLLLCAFVLQVMPVGAQQQMFLTRTQQAAPPPSAGLLDPDYKGSAFAAAIDVLLYGSYTATDDIPGSQTFGQSGQWSVAILRDFDDAIKSFTPSQVADGTANAWVQALGPSDGFVRRWYDQSVTDLDVSNLNHADQSDPTKMPKLFDSSTGLILENGKAAMQFGLTNSIELSINSNVACETIAVIATNSSFVAANYVLVGSTGVHWGGGFPGVNGIKASDSANLLESSIEDFNQHLALVQSGAPGSLRIDGVEEDNGTLSSIDVNIVGRRNLNLYMRGTIQLVCLWEANQSNIPTLESTINNEYNIYP